MLIYKVTCLINHKTYIGVTTRIYPFKNIEETSFVKKSKVQVFLRNTKEFIGEWRSHKKCAKDLKISREAIRWYLTKLIKNWKLVKHPYHFEVVE